MDKRVQKSISKIKITLNEITFCWPVLAEVRQVLQPRLMLQHLQRRLFPKIVISRLLFFLKTKLYELKSFEVYQEF